MNFYEFAQYAAERLKTTEILYLDGTISAMYTYQQAFLPSAIRL
ncbi:hypothetical protein [Budvicia diplopodorum]|nr:hypothetical protein [Budvicia diplopodorum]